MRTWVSRLAAGLVLTGVSAVAIAAEPAKPSAPVAVAPAAKPAPAPAVSKIPPCANPEGLGISRVVEIDTTGGPGFGFEHYKVYDFLQDHEVVLTFDDGPWPGNTPSVLATLALNCSKATFFSIGKHALYHPEILKQVAAAGHTVGTHTWSHADLSKLTPDQAKEEIEKGLSAVKLALGEQPASFFRFPYLRGPQEIEAYLGSRNLAIFSTDIDSFDFKHGKSPDAIIKTVMEKLEKRGKGIVLLHDFQKHTAEALPKLMAELKAQGFKLVHLKSKSPAASIASYDAEIEKGARGLAQQPGVGQPASNVVKTIAGEPQGAN